MLLVEPTNVVLYVVDGCERSMTCALARRSLGGGIEVQVPATHTGFSTGQTIPHAPQLLLSLPVFTHVMLPEQNVGVPAGQLHAPAVQTRPLVHVTPQLMEAAVAQ